MDDFDYYDPYDSIPFGDAMRFEDEQVARDMDAGEADENADLPLDEGDLMVAVMLYLHHASGSPEHTGENWVEACPTCDGAFLTAQEMRAIEEVADFVTAKVAQLQGTVGA